MVQDVMATPKTEAEFTAKLKENTVWQVVNKSTRRIVKNFLWPQL